MALEVRSEAEQALAAGTAALSETLRTLLAEDVAAPLRPPVRLAGLCRSPADRRHPCHPRRSGGRCVGGAVAPGREGEGSLTARHAASTVRTAVRNGTTACARPAAGSSVGAASGARIGGAKSCGCGASRVLHVLVACGQQVGAVRWVRWARCGTEGQRNRGTGGQRCGGPERWCGSAAAPGSSGSSRPRESRVIPRPIV